MKFQKSVNSLMEDFLRNNPKLRNVRYVSFVIPESSEKIAVEITLDSIKYYTQEIHNVYEDIKQYDITTEVIGGELSLILNRYNREYLKIQDYMKGFNIEKIVLFGVVVDKIFSITGGRVTSGNVTKDMPPQWWTLLSMQLNFMAENPKVNLHFTKITNMFENFESALNHKFDTDNTYIEPFDTFSSIGDSFFRIKVN